MRPETHHSLRSLDDVIPECVFEQSVSGIRVVLVGTILVGIILTCIALGCMVLGCRPAKRIVRGVTSDIISSTAWHRFTRGEIQISIFVGPC